MRLWTLRGTYTNDEVDGSGMEVVDQDGWTLRRYELEPGKKAETRGCVVFRVAGVSYREAEVKKRCFEPGKRVKLVPEPDNPHDGNAIKVVDESGQHHCGYVPADSNQGIRRLMDEGWSDAVMLWQWRKGKPSRRVGLQVALFAPGVYAGEAPGQLRALARSREDVASPRRGPHEVTVQLKPEKKSGGCATLFGYALVAIFVLVVVGQFLD